MHKGKNVASKRQDKLHGAKLCDLPFGDEEFDFVLDMGCFHHVEIEDRTKFIKGVHRVLKIGGSYLLICFSYKNGPTWNHFAKNR
jgi:ubiquinone/menaquinone biosynthesis C-methylase UbiE